MKIIIAGSTGMVGNLIVNNCLASEIITEVISLVRKPSGLKHHKLNEVVIQNFEDYSQHDYLFKDISIGFFCLGAYTGKDSDALFRKITVDFAVEFAKALERNSPNSTICLLSGAGADRTEQSKTSFARYKGMAENQISKLNLKFYSFRPAYIYPVQPRKEPNVAYALMRVLYPIIKIFGDKISIKSTELASAMLQVGINGADKQILENADILRYKTV